MTDDYLSHARIEAIRASAATLADHLMTTNSRDYHACVAIVEDWQKLDPDPTPNVYESLLDQLSALDDGLQEDAKVNR